MYHVRNMQAWIHCSRSHQCRDVNYHNNLTLQLYFFFFFRKWKKKSFEKVRPASWHELKLIYCQCDNRWPKLTECWDDDTITVEKNHCLREESLKNSSRVSCFTCSRASELWSLVRDYTAKPLSKEKLFKWLKYFRCPPGQKKQKQGSWLRGVRVPPDLLVNQKVGQVNPGLHWPHSAAPQLWSDKHVCGEESPLTWWQRSAPGLTPQVTTDLTWQQWERRKEELRKAIKISPYQMLYLSKLQGLFSKSAFDHGKKPSQDKEGRRFNVMYSWLWSNSLESHSETNLLLQNDPKYQKTIFIASLPSLMIGFHLTHKKIRIRLRYSHLSHEGDYIEMLLLGMSFPMSVSVQVCPYLYWNGCGLNWKWGGSDERLFIFETPGLTYFV